VVCLSVILVSPAKTSEPNVMLFEGLIRVNPRSYVLDGVQIPSWEGAILRGKDIPDDSLP